MNDQLDSASQNYPIMQFFKFGHLPQPLSRTSRPFAELALEMCKGRRSAETSAGLRKLLEAKDCFVRAAL